MEGCPGTNNKNLPLVVPLTRVVALCHVVTQVKVKSLIHHTSFNLVQSLQLFTEPVDKACVQLNYC